MKLFSDNQKKWFLKRKIQVGEFYMFPMMGFNAYEYPDHLSKSVFLDTNPFTKSLAEESFLVKRIKNGFAGGNFSNKPKGPDFYIPVDELEGRNFIETFFLFIFCSIPIIVYNIFNQIKK